MGGARRIFAEQAAVAPSGKQQGVSSAMFSSRLTDGSTSSLNPKDLVTFWRHEDSIVSVSSFGDTLTFDIVVTFHGEEPRPLLTLQNLMLKKKR